MSNTNNNATIIEKIEIRVLQQEVNRLKQLVEMYEIGLLNPVKQRVNSSHSKPSYFKVIRGGL